MKRDCLILVAHPNPDSLCAALAAELSAAAAEMKIDVEVIDLYRTGFDPVLRVEEARRRFSFDEAIQTWQERVRRAGLVVWIHPDWWGGMPALLKGWIDRVLQPGFAFSFEEEEDGRFRRQPLLKGRGALTLITSDADAVVPVPAVDIWQQRVFPYCGFNPAEVLLLPETRSSDYLARKEFIRAGREALTRMIATEGEA